MKFRYVIALSFIFLFGCIFVGVNYSNTKYDIANTIQLIDAVQKANNIGNATLVIQPGTYRLPTTLYITSSGITIKSSTGNAEDVIIEGEAMSANGKVGNLIRVSGSNFEINGITLRNSRYHLIQIAGEDNADNITIRNCVFQDAYQQLIKISGSNVANHSSNNGIIENSRFEYTAGIGPQFYIGGIDGHHVENWVIRNNIFINIASPEKTQAEHAIHFWSDSRDLTITNNWIINSDRGIGLGMGERGASQAVIANNVIFHNNNDHPFADVGIAIENGHDILVANNTVYLAHNYPRSIEYRFQRTKNIRLINNATNKPIVSRDGASGNVLNNYTQLTDKDIYPGPGKKPILLASDGLVEKGLALKDISHDIFFNARNQKHPSIGAVEF